MSLACKIKFWKLRFEARTNLYVPCLSHMFTATIWHLKVALGSFNLWQDVEGMLRQPPILDSMPQTWCGGKKKKKKKRCVRVCLFAYVCDFPCISIARLLLCQSVATVEHPGIAQASISRLPWMNAYRHTEIHTELPKHPDKARVQRNPRLSAGLLKGYSCCECGHEKKMIWPPKIQKQTTGRFASPFCQLDFSSRFVDNNLVDICFITEWVRNVHFGVVLKTLVPDTLDNPLERFKWSKLIFKH